ncbi:serine/threonine-protein kinase [Williamsia phyllosphaerae]|uniref:serine/threonine-protein kinase n=1 Tax=Williamsia phyllosphaerae TaxID=885042 RepID=UPI001E337397|nr:serine/threonine-protein kinase [Williamsia phyllosphaerae]
MTVPHHPRQVPGPGFLVAGRYRLRSKLGGGGMGAVWLATDQLLEREVAVKQVVSTEGLTEESASDVRSRALREGRMAARLSHRNAIAMHDLALESGEPWLVMEYLPSRSVAQILHTTTTLPVAYAAHIGAQVAAAMATAHSEGIVHRDIKPGNILIANTGRAAGTVKISDFGISRAKDDIANVESGVITGTPAYFAPELARGGEPTEASDVYSLGATVYTAVEGEPPFGVDEDSLVLLHRVARGEITPPTRAGDLTPALLAMLEPSPGRRPTMAQARDQLARIAAGPGGNVGAVLQSPLPRNDSAIPIWGLSGRSSTRSNRSAPRTESGLPAARVLHPTSARPAAGPAPEPTPPTPTPTPSEPVAGPPAPPTPPTPPTAPTLPISPAVIGVGAVILLVLLMIVLVVAL